MKFLLLIIPLLFCACTVKPLVDIGLDKTPRPFADSGKATFADYKKKWPIVKNRKVDRVTDRLTKVLPTTEDGWEVITFNFKNPNAFALPGGKIGINQGLLPLTHTDSELATVIAHEAAHILKNHHFERDSRARVLSLIAKLPQQTEQQRARYEALKEKLTHDLPELSEMELEADQVGLIYMARAGYNPREAIAFWERFAGFRDHHGLTHESDLETHPNDRSRITNLLALLPYAIKEYQRSPYKPQ